MEQIVNDVIPLAGIACWVHWYILVGIILTAAGGIFVITRRQRFSDKLKSYEEKVLNDDEDRRVRSIAG